VCRDYLVLIIAVCFFRENSILSYLIENDEDNAAARLYLSLRNYYTKRRRKNIYVVYIDYQIKIDATKNIVFFILKCGYHMSYNK